MRKLVYIIKFLFFITLSSNAIANSLDDLKVNYDSNGQVQMVLSFSEDAKVPSSFAMENPSKVVFDFPNVTSNIKKNKSTRQLDMAGVKSLSVLDNDRQLRVLVNTSRLLPYTTKKMGKKLFITFNSTPKSLVGDYHIKDFDFTRNSGSYGSGRLVLKLSDDKVPVDLAQMKEKVRVKFQGAKVPSKMLQTYDVRDFGTPVTKFSGAMVNNDYILDIITHGEYRKSAYQIDNKLVIDIVDANAKDSGSDSDSNFQYVGEKITLSYQDISVRFALEQLAEFADINVVISDKVDGDITIRLEDIPWDQALDLILQSKGLSKRKNGNVIVVGTLEELAQQELLELENKEKQKTLEPLVSELFQLNYIKAKDFVNFISGNESSINKVSNQQEKEVRSQEDRNGILSWRGTYVAEDRTNTVVVSDVKQVIEEIKKLVARVDVPVKQVEIATNIVEISDGSGYDFGITLSGAAQAKVDKTRIGIGNSISHAFDNANADAGNLTIKKGDDNYNFFSLGKIGGGSATASSAPSLGVAIAKLPGGTILDMELSALESENKATTLASPKILTLDKVRATLEHGTEQPYEVKAGDTGTSIEFKKAVLSVDFTPHISPNNQIKLDLVIRHDAVGNPPENATNAPISTKNITTSILVDNGETVVIGGLFNTKKYKSISRVPFFSRLPLVGKLFKSESLKDNRDELLIFVTPKIIENAKDVA